MDSRIDFLHVSPRAVQAMMGLQSYVNASGLEPSLLELLKMRASQSNGCAYCLDLHSKGARAAGETELVDLALAVVAINGWNRLCISFRAEAGSYRPRGAKAPAFAVQGGS